MRDAMERYGWRISDGDGEGLRDREDASDASDASALDAEVLRLRDWGDDRGINRFDDAAAAIFLSPPTLA